MKVSRQNTFVVSASHRSSQKNFCGFPQSIKIISTWAVVKFTQDVASWNTERCIWDFRVYMQRHLTMENCYNIPVNKTILTTGISLVWPDCYFSAGYLLLTVTACSSYKRLLFNSNWNSFMEKSFVETKNHKNRETFLPRNFHGIWLTHALESTNFINPQALSSSLTVLMCYSFGSSGLFSMVYAYNYNLYLKDKWDFMI